MEDLIEFVHKETAIDKTTIGIILELEKMFLGAKIFSEIGDPFKGD